MKKLNKDNKGFSLVELLVVIAIMVVLVGVIAPSLLSNIEKTREAKDFQALDTIAGNIQAAMVNEDVYDAIIAKNGAAIDLQDAYKGNAFTGTGVDNANAKLKSSLEDSLAAKAVFTSDDAAGDISLFGSKTAANAIDGGAKIYFSVDKTTGEVKVTLGTKDGSGNVTAATGKSVDFTVTR